MKIFLLMLAAQPAFAAAESWSFHDQATFVTQEHPGFSSPYSGPKSLASEEKPQTSVTATLFLGARAWKGLEAYLDPELSGGSGLSSTAGVAGFPNGEIYRVDDTRPKWSLARAFVRQTFGLGGGEESEDVAGDQNQLAGRVDRRRVVLVAGRFALNDYLDQVSYAHDPRTQFLNWTLMDFGAWDYAADTRGYTWGLLVEWREKVWTVRFASALEPVAANQLELSTRYPRNRGDNLEFEYRYPGGVARALVYRNQADMGAYAAATADVTLTRGHRVKAGAGLSVEQELGSGWGGFGRFSFADGRFETWAFTEIERAIALGATHGGAGWGRPADVVGLALLGNGLAGDHRDYLARGGAGFMVGDGRLNYAWEQIFEGYYSLKAVDSLALTADFQFIRNPGYNADRGPVPVFAARMHYAM
jgi:high affinity Mn2+ porin